VPIGALPKVKDVLETATLQARITHDTPAALFSARLVALMAHYTLYAAKDFDGLYGYCRGHLPPEDQSLLDSIQSEWTGPVDGKRFPLAIETVHAVCHIIRTNFNLSWMLEDAICLGGDTDSVAAIAWGIASTFHRQEKLKDFFVRDLEPGRATGSGYLRELSFRLMQAYA
jgi:ADP-ribosylglycohydrolase